MLRMSFYSPRALPSDLQSNALEPAKQYLSTCKAMLCELQTNAPYGTEQWVVGYKAMLLMK
jgi:hypothetical protein